MRFADRLQHAWNAFKGETELKNTYKDVGASYNYRVDRSRLSFGNDKSFLNALLTRISIDSAAVNVEHVRVDENENYLETIKSSFNNALNVEANIDQTGRAFIQDIVMSMLDEGVIAVVPTDTTLNPKVTGSYDILEMRVAKILQWFPEFVQVRVYNEKEGKKEDIILPKKMVAIVENPLYSVMNSPNSTLKRLVAVLNKLDVVNDQNASGKLDLIIQFPYSVNTVRRKNQAEARRKDIEKQLAESKYGIAYADGTERITQLNRSVENNLLAQVEYFTKLLYSQLGLSENVFNGTATEEEMLNYYERTIKPILCAVTEEMTRKFLTKTARTQGQTVWFAREPFKLISAKDMAEIADTFIRNEILTKNEVRAIIGYKPSDDPRADELQNPNMYPDEQDQMIDDAEMIQNGGGGLSDEEYNDLSAQIDSLSAYNDVLDNFEKQLGHSEFMTDTVYDKLVHNLMIDFDEVDETKFNDYLIHYASPYYDPVYAHEYYEKHKKLKGRNTLSEKGREVADYVTKQLNAERDAKINTSKTNTSNKLTEAQTSRQNAITSSSNTMTKNIETKKAATQSAIDNHKQQMANQIEQLQNDLAEWGYSGKAGKAKEIRNKIARLREQNLNAQAQLKMDLSTYSGQERTEHSNRSARATSEYQTSANTIKTAGSTEISKIKEDYENRLADEMGRIMAEYPAEEKTKSSGSSGVNPIIAEYKQRRKEAKAKKKS